MTIPSKFIIHGHTITVNIVEFCDDPGEFGCYNSVLEEITIATKVLEGTKAIELKQYQIEHTFVHELLHCFQFHIRGSYDESEAQSYAGLFLEFLNTKENV
jgi:hypothetical protein